RHPAALGTGVGQIVELRAVPLVELLHLCVERLLGVVIELPFQAREVVAGRRTGGGRREEGRGCQCNDEMSHDAGLLIRSPPRRQRVVSASYCCEHHARIAAGAGSVKEEVTSRPARGTSRPQPETNRGAESMLDLVLVRARAGDCAVDPVTRISVRMGRGGAAAP